MSAPAQVLLALQRLTHALGADSPSCYPVLLPLLAVSTDVNQVPNRPLRVKTCCAQLPEQLTSAP